MRNSGLAIRRRNVDGTRRRLVGFVRNHSTTPLGTRFAGILALCMVAIQCTVVQAQSPEPSAPSTGRSLGPERVEFERLFSEWKNVLKDLRDLQFRFNIAEEQEVSELREQFYARREVAAAMVEDVARAARLALAADDQANRDLALFVLKLADDDLARDRYDAAWEAAEVLIDHSTLEAAYDLAGTVAFALHKFDLAEKYLKQSEEAGSLRAGRDAQAFLPSIPEQWAAEQEKRRAEAEADDLPRVRLETSQGVITVELFENEAPGTVGNFIHLVEQKFYDGLTFHRVLPGFVAQAGCPQGDGTGDAGYKIYCECYGDDYRLHFRGSLSMAKGTDRDTGGSQFFITFVPTPFLNGRHTVFGRVIDGWDVLPKLQRRDPTQPSQVNIEPDTIIRATVIRKRDHEYRPNPAPQSPLGP